MHFNNNTFRKNFIFHSNLSFKTSVLHQFPTFYANILQSWKRNFSHISYTPSCIGSQFLWFNNYITIDNNSAHFKEFLSHHINFINHLFTSERKRKDWNHIEREFQLTNNLYYKFTQISHAISRASENKYYKKTEQDLCYIPRSSLKGCVCYIFASLFFMSEREGYWIKEECFLFYLESSFHSWDNQNLTFQIFKCHDVIKCPSMKQEIYFTE